MSQVEINVRINDILRSIIRVPLTKKGLELCRQFLSLLEEEMPQ